MKVQSRQLRYYFRLVVSVQDQVSYHIYVKYTQWSNALLYYQV